LPSPIAAPLKVTAILEELFIPYFIGGSVASTLYCMVRTTQDSGLIAGLQPEHIRPLVLALESEFFIDADLIADAVARRSSFIIIHRESMFKVDAVRLSGVILAGTAPAGRSCPPIRMCARTWPPRKTSCSRNWIGSGREANPPNASGATCWASSSCRRARSIAIIYAEWPKN
jgi:hypothetical protein